MYSNRKLQLYECLDWARADSKAAAVERVAGTASRVTRVRQANAG